LRVVSHALPPRSHPLLWRGRWSHSLPGDVDRPHRGHDRSLVESAHRVAQVLWRPVLIPGTNLWYPLTGPRLP
jgi:hypothetical protein